MVVWTTVVQECSSSSVAKLIMDIGVCVHLCSIKVVTSQWIMNGFTFQTHHHLALTHMFHDIDMLPWWSMDSMHILTSSWISSTTLMLWHTPHGTQIVSTQCQNLMDVWNNHPWLSIASYACLWMANCH
jgi:hypothetical protein